MTFPGGKSTQGGSAYAALTLPAISRTIDTTELLIPLLDRLPVIPRRFLAALVLALAVLLVTFAVLAAASLLAGALGDVPAAIVLRWVALAALILLAIDALLLLAVLGIRAAQQDEQDEP